MLKQARHVVAAVALIPMLAVGMVGIAAPVSAASCYNFDVKRLYAHVTEESTDEISLQYLDVDHRADIRRGGRTFPPDSDFCVEEFEVNLWELDSGSWYDPHDYLGKITVGSWQIGREQSKWFSGHGTSYELVYHVYRA